MTSHPVEHLAEAAAAPARRTAGPGRIARVAATLAGLLAGAFAGPLMAATALADSPVFAVQQAPGNVALVLSVEYPTVVSVAYINRSYSASGPDYLGYFDPAKCYTYQWSSADKTTAPSTTASSYFAPSGLASNHLCSSQSGRWSGHFLNWATMQTIDPFRWVLTGGFRVRDDPSLTVVEKAWHSGQGGEGNFPSGFIAAADIAGATPFGSFVTQNGSSQQFQFRVQGEQNQMRFAVGPPPVTYNVAYYNCTNFSCPAITPTPSTVLDFSAIRNSASPDTADNVSANSFGARYTASIVVPTTGNYSFRVQADDGARLYLNGSTTPIVTTTSYNQPATSAQVSLVAGDTLSIQLDYYQYGGGANLSFDWQLPNGTWLPFGKSTLWASGSAVDYTGASITGGTAYNLFVRAKVCDPSPSAGGLESNCVAYGQNYKPQGLIHTYSNKLRFSAIGYLNDSSLYRDAGVLRARQKFVGPTQPVPGAPPVVNAPGASPGQTTSGEWDASTGLYILNPDSADVTATNAASAATVTSSGVMNYLNKFGEFSPHNAYKGNDPVSELYYAAVRYFKNLGNVPEWSDLSGLSATDATRLADSFPVITNWGDPILYSCQKNFILGIGDVNTHGDKNVPGNTNPNSEPPMPEAVKKDTTVNAVTATNTVGVLEGLGSSIGTTTPYNGCCDLNSALMAGLAYDSHVNDIRPDLPLNSTATKQRSDYSTIDTYWVDVQEGGRYLWGNQFYLATKYGGFLVPDGYKYGDPLGVPATNLTSWHNNTDSFVDSNGTITSNNGKVNLRPDNYYSGGSPDLMRSGLTSAFADIASKQKPVSTAFSTGISQIGNSGNASFSSKYEASTWTGEVTANALSFDSSGNPVATPTWTFAGLLKTQLASTGWDLNRRVVTWNPSTAVAVPFRTASLSAGELTALDTSYVSGDDSARYLNYLRGDQTNEKGSTASGSTLAYRARAALVGDIVDSKLRVVGPPTFPYLDATNPGYAAFKSTYAARPTVVYFGANDGMLHAVNGNLAAATTTPPGPGGVELFAYVPSALFTGPGSTPNADGLASLGNPAFNHHFMVDATPAQFDVDFTRTPGATATAAGDWRSLLIGGLGKGGKSYYAIDVTDSVGLVAATGAAASATDAAAKEQTVAGRVLWEFSASSTVPLGYSFGDPLVAKTRKYGWVVVVPSGYNNADGIGRLFLLNPRTGALLETLSTGAGSASNDAGLAQVNSFINDSTDGTVDSLYAGDLLGNLWRFDLTALAGPGNYPAPTKIAVLTDANGNVQPVTTAPSIAVDPTTRKRFVLVGTGRLLDSTDISSTQQQTFYAIVDGTDARFNAASDLPKGPPAVTFPIGRSSLYNNVSSLDTVTFEPTTQAGWYEDVGSAGGTGTGSGWRVVKNASTLAGAVLFSTTRPDLSNVCSPGGTSRLYGRELRTASTILLTPVVPGATAVDTAYYDYSTIVTDQQFFSVEGKTVGLVGTLGGLEKPNLKVLPAQSLRRLNWRELRVVD